MSDVMRWTPWQPKLGALVTGPKGTIAAVRLRSGVEIDTRGRNGIAMPLAWTHVGSSSDIVGYSPWGAE